MFAVALLAGKKAGDRRPSSIIRLGFALLTVGMVVLIPIVPRADSGWYLVVPLVIAGSGLGLLVSQLNNYTLAPIAEERVSEAAGVNSAAGSFGLSFGLAVRRRRSCWPTLSITFTHMAESSTVLSPAEQQQVADALEDDAEVMSNTQLEEQLAGQPRDVQDEIIRINTDARPHRAPGRAADPDPRRPHRAAQLVPDDAPARPAPSDLSRGWPSASVRCVPSERPRAAVREPPDGGPTGNAPPPPADRRLAAALRAPVAAGRPHRRGRRRRPDRAEEPRVRRHRRVPLQNGLYAAAAGRASSTRSSARRGRSRPGRAPRWRRSPGARCCVTGLSGDAGGAARGGDHAGHRGPVPAAGRAPDGVDRPVPLQGGGHRASSPGPRSTSSSASCPS